MQIGKGETKNFIYEITDKDNIFTDENELLFAVKSVNGDSVFSEAKKIKDLTKQENQYVYRVELPSTLTNTFVVGKDKYFFDLTLVDGEKKIPLTNVKSIDVTETVGASLSEV